MPPFFAEDQTRALIEAIREIEVDPNTFLGAKYMPAVDVPTRQIYMDVIEARGGITQEHTLGADPRTVQRRQFRMQEFAPGSYREFIRFNEQEILYLRELGRNDQSGRGIRQHLNENAVMLNNRLESRIELLRWQAILDGTFEYKGKTVDYGRPASHNVSPTAPWMLVDNGHARANPASNPVQDLRFWLMGGYAPFRKYKIKKVVLNPNTARVILENPAVQALIQTRFAADTYRQHDVSAVLSFLIPGMPEIEIYNGWYQEENIDPITGQITVGDGIYFIPDGRVFFESTLPGGDVIGDFAMALTLANGSIDNPQPGKFLSVDEHIDSHKGNPYIDVYCGVAGGPRLKRGFDLLTADVL